MANLTLQERKTHMRQLKRALTGLGMGGMLLLLTACDWFSSSGAPPPSQQNPPPTQCSSGATDPPAGCIATVSIDADATCSVAFSDPCHDLSAGSQEALFEQTVQTKAAIACSQAQPGNPGSVDITPAQAGVQTVCR